MAPFLCRAEEDLKSRTKAAWAKRGDPAKAKLALDLYEKMAAKDPDDFDSRIKLAKAAYWVVEMDDQTQAMSKDQKVKISNKGVKACKEVLVKNEDHVGASYWLMWNMAARTYNKGIFSGFAFKDSIVCTIMVAKGDINYEYGGIWRYWARVIFEIPSLLGKFFHFTDEDTIWLLKRSLDVNPNYLRTRFWLAESYEDMDKDDLAKKEYEFCVNYDENTIPQLAPENRLYKKWAQERLEEM
jgi:hypothetical protein